MAKQQIFSVSRMAKQVSSLGQRNEEWKKKKKRKSLCTKSLYLKPLNLSCTWKMDKNKEENNWFLEVLTCYFTSFQIL